MRIRSLSVSILSAVVLVPLCSVPAAVAADSNGTARTAAISGSVWKNSATKRRPFVGPVAVVAPRTAPAPAPVVRAPAPVAPAPVPKPAPVVNPALAYQSEVLVRTNAERTRRGLRALTVSGCADRFADAWASRLASLGSLSHQALSPILSTCGARRVGENVAFGNVTPAALVKMWMDSPGHRANILNPAFTAVGVGSVTTSSGRVYGVQVFLGA